MCSAEGSAHVPMFSKTSSCFFTEFDVEINYQKYGGTEFSHIFPPQYQETQLPAATYCHCTEARQVGVIDTVTNLRLNRRTMWNILDSQERHCIHLFPITRRDC